MKLYINTTINHFIEIALKDDCQVLAGKKLEAKYAQAERLLPEIEKLLTDSRYVLSDIEKIEVENRNKNNDSSFTALRVGVIVANALGYALGVKVEGTDYSSGQDVIEFDIIKPAYGGKPNINLKN